ncbi:hypothetical protein DXG03_004089 [Asterophora parasitica]|uniref:Uncharacterized protein n=1 Tax=Asterophora parasitica TaxID=117018 RepID=A0A9P7KAG0_9AGAR|nr:hypothetical protein DXG03_004089 [Asterophora parasitica]
MIPLNDDWTYGGLTSPASTAEPSRTSDIPITTTAIPPTLTSFTSIATPTSSSSPVSSIPTLTSPTFPTQTSIPPPPPPSANSLSRGQLIGVIVASILGFIFLFIAILLLYLCCRHRRNREEPIWEAPTPIDQGWHALERERNPTGEEGDPLMRASGVPTQAAQARDSTGSAPPGSPALFDSELGGRQVPPYVGIARVPVPPVESHSSKESGGSASTNSGYGVVIPHTIFNPETLAELRRDQALTPEQIQRLEEESVRPSGGDSSLTPPPRLVDPDLWSPGPEHLPFTNKASLGSLSGYPDADEAATLLIARRVRVEDLASRSPPHLPQPLSYENGSNRNSGGFLSNLGLGGLSWFKNIDGHPWRNSRHAMLPDDDLEVGQALLGPEMSESQSSRRLIGLGMANEGDRPLSTASGRSIATVYHDAHSSLPGTPASKETPLAPLPRALTPSAPPPLPAWPPNSTVPALATPPLDRPVPAPTHSYSSSITNVNHGLPVGYDVLDTPAPTAISPFASTSSISSLRETMTGSSTGLSAHPFPPGLDVPTKSWSDESSTATHVNSPLSLLSNQDTSPAVSIDILEEAPPPAREGWRTLAAEHDHRGSQRTTFGHVRAARLDPLLSIDRSFPQFVTPFDNVPEEASLYSMRSHLSPAHSRSTGSAPGSRRDGSGSIGSGSSRPSAFAQSLSHSSSISSDARKRVSPTMSAFGGRSPVPSPLIDAPPSAHFVPERAGTHRQVGSLDIDAARTSTTSPEPTSPLSQLSSAPWAAGLDNNWTPT